MKFSIALGMGAALAPVAMASPDILHHANNLLGRMAMPENKLSDRTVKIRTGQGSRNEVTANRQTEVIVIWANPGGGAERTQVNEKVTVTQTVTAGAGNAVGGVQTSSASGAGATQTVKVGGEELTFNPPEIRANAGDMVIFEFHKQKHSATQSSFADPCSPLEGGMDTGLIGNANDSVVPPPQVAMQVMTTNPLWFYCKAKTHCGKGMGMAINPTADKTLATFLQTAIAKNGTGMAAPITGGTPAAGGEKAGEMSSSAALGSTSLAPERATSALGSGETQPTGITGGIGEGGATAPGKGTVGADGSCDCVAACAAGSFPAMMQGVGSFGGMGGSLPANMAAMRR